MITVSNITKDFGATRALDDLSFTVNNGVAFGLLGRNGAGKTTTIRIIMNIFQADKGEVLINGVSSKKSTFRIGYLPEERGLYPKRTIKEQMIYIGKLRGMTKEQALISSKAKLEELEAIEYLDRKLDSLSKGNQQKIQLAIALINDPDIVILDEPFSGLDPVNAQILKNIVRKEVDKGKTVIFSSHQMAQVEEFCDDICLINKGKVVLDGKLDAIKRSYPRTNIFMEFADLEGEYEDAKYVQLDNRIQLNLGLMKRNIVKDGKTVTVQLKSPEQRTELFNVLQSINMVPSKFNVIEPSLEDIFVEKVGGDEIELADKDNENNKKEKRGLFGKRKAAK